MQNWQEARLRWYSHAMRREDENSMKRIMSAEVNGCYNRGRQKKWWGYMKQQDIKSLWLKKEHQLQLPSAHTGDWRKWRGRIRVADPTPLGGIHSSRKEEIYRPWCILLQRLFAHYLRFQMLISLPCNQHQAQEAIPLHILMPAHSYKLLFYGRNRTNWKLTKVINT